MDITQLVAGAAWSGNYQSVARKLELELAVSSDAPNLPVISIELGDHILLEEGEILFDGFVMAITVNTDATTKTVSCYDRGIYLNQSQGYYQFQNALPEEICRRVASDFGIKIGQIEATGIQISRNFLGVPLYKIIATGYTLAAARTGEKYHLGFEADRLIVRKKQQDANTLVIRPGSNLMDATTTESIEKLVNRVRIVGSDYQLIDTKEDTASVEKYGVMQRVLQQSEDSDAEARQLLEDNQPTQKITVNCLGDVRSMTGRMVALRVETAGLWGLFWIESDTHTWRNGIYTNKLVLNFKAVMDKIEAGTGYE